MALSLNIDIGQLRIKDTAPPLVNERKLVADDSHVEMALALLETVCVGDPQYPFGRISSIYYDSPALTFFDEKANGDNLKRKVRMRWYDSDDYTPASLVPVFFEIKFRTGAARDKMRFSAKVPAARLLNAPLDDPYFSELLYRHAPGLGDAVPLGLVPSLCISYDRNRYVCPFTGSRVALDRRIRAERVNAALFPSHSEIRLSRTVCEFKNSEGLFPPWLHSLLCAGFRMRSFSKYGECIHQIIQGSVNE